ncbi:MAG: hypothetical protein DMF93_20380 [Acidobacteria bacterium]|nr:MAG: hypothetical protein DMF93_20380 [Acidobacteriota bacterium]
MRRRRRLAAHREVDAFGRVRRDDWRRERRGNQAGEDERRQPHHDAGTRGSTIACATSAAMLNATTAAAESISIAMSTV